VLRPSVEKLTAQQLAKLQEAIGAMATISDDRGYQHFASLHGGPPKSYCQHGYADQWHRYHGAPLFLPWHRAYLHFFELAMADRVADVTLAWWDWSSPQSHAEGIPAGYEGAGNSLAAQPIAEGAAKPKGIPAVSWREPDKPENLPDGKTVEGILGSCTTRCTAGWAGRWAAFRSPPMTRSSSRITAWSTGCGGCGSSSTASRGRRPVHRASCSIPFRSPSAMS
jgi:hypothetical protein